MKKALFCLLFLCLLACGKIKPAGQIVTEEFPLEKFNALELSGNYRLFLISGEQNLIVAEGYQNIIDNLKFSNNDLSLKIREKRGVISPDFYNLTIYTTSPIQKITVTDSVEVNISGVNKTENFELVLDKSAIFIGNINTGQAKISMSDVSRANFSGFATQATIKTIDTANIIAPNLRIGSLKIDAHNGTYTEVAADDTISGEIFDTAKFLYYNDPVRKFKVGKKTTVTNQRLN